MTRSRMLWPLAMGLLIVVALVLWGLTLSWVYRPVASGNARALAGQDIFQEELQREEANLALAAESVTRPPNVADEQPSESAALPPQVTSPVARLDLPGQPDAAAASAGQTSVRVIRPPRPRAEISDAAQTGPVNTSGLAAAGTQANTPPTGPLPPSLRLLIVQTNQDQLDQGQASSVVLIHLDPGTRRTQLVTLPPTIRVVAATPGQTTASRLPLGETYARGGLPLMLRSVEQFTGRPIDAYLEISQGGMFRLIGGLGSVSLDSPAAVQGSLRVYPAGTVTLTAQEALDYVGGTNAGKAGGITDPEAARAERSQRLMDALVARLSTQNPSGLFSALPGMKGTVRTDLTPTELLRWQREYPFLFTAQRQLLNVAGTRSLANGQSEFQVSDAERVRLFRSLR